MGILLRLDVPFLVRMTQVAITRHFQTDALHSEQIQTTKAPPAFFARRRFEA
jgi:hypothetical protein